MSLVASLNCPHCFTSLASFVFQAEVIHPTETRVTLVFSCPACFEVVGIRAFLPNRVSEFARGKTGPLDAALRKAGGTTLGTYPKAQTVAVPDHVSDSVARCFKQADDNALRRQHDAAGAMYRKCLDLATRELDPSSAGKKLASRIDNLHKQGKLTADLKDWAHAIRLDGNEAAHDNDELTAEEVAQLASFTDLFLRYTFTLPHQVAVRNADLASAVAVSK